MEQISDIRIVETRELVAPDALLEALAADEAVAAHIVQSRQAVEKIVHGGDDRLLVVAGPCSIHDPKAAMGIRRQTRRRRRNIPKPIAHCNAGVF